MSAILVRGAGKLGFLTEAAKDPRLTPADLALLVKIVLLDKAAAELERFGPEKMIRGRVQRLALLGYCCCTKTMSRRFEVAGKRREQRNKLLFTFDCDKRL